jgi:membrane protein YqaA with SNARE-associated domain
VLTADWQESLGLIGATYLFCLVGGVIPVMNAEVYLASAGAMSDRSMIFPLVLAGTLGQMTAKTGIFLAGQGLLRLPIARDSERMRIVLAKAQAWRGPVELFVFISAVVGIPPFYIVSLLGGALKLSLVRFIVIGCVGRFIRFFVVVAGANAAIG